MKGQRAHPGAEAIAACMGEVRTWRARRVAAHIAVCPSCSALERQLGQVTAVLATVPPAPLPGDVALRLDAALAAEVAARAASGSTLPEAGVPAAVPSGPAAVPPEPVVPPGSAPPDGQHRHRPPAPRWAWRVLRPAPVLAALALCLVLGGGGYLISQSGGTSSNAPMSTAAGKATGKTAAQARSQTPVFGGHALVPGPVSPAGAPSFTVTSTNTDYVPATLRSQALSELSSSVPSEGTAPSGQLTACVMQVAGTDYGKVAFVDLARYQGRPATIVVAQNHAWVTGWGCNATQHRVIDSVSLSGG